MKHTLRNLSKKDKQGLVLIAISMLILLVLIISLLVVSTSKDRQYDKVTLCNEHINRESNNIFIFDISDPLSVHQKEFLINRFKAIIDASNINDKFSLFTLDNESKGISSPISSVCMPKRPENTNLLTENSDFIKENFQNKFYLPMEKSLSLASIDNTMSSSPIFEAISDIKSLGYLDKNAQINNIYLISDMLQNTNQYSVYSSKEKAISSLPNISMPNTQFIVYWLDRTSNRKYQTARLAKEWAKYFDSIASLSLIEKVRD